METMGYEMDGDGGGDSVVGYVMGDGSVMGVDGSIMGAAAPRKPGQMVRIPPQPNWRKRQVAPGVSLPGEGLEPLPLTPTSADGTWTATNPAARIVFTGKVQRPFAPERLLLGVGRFADETLGTPQNRVVTDTLFFGTTLGQLQRGEIDLELLGAPTAFGVRMKMVDVQPGVDVEIPVYLKGTALADDQSIVVTMIWLGRSIQ